MMNNNWKSYNAGPFFDELITGSGQPRVAARRVVKLLQSLPNEEMASRRAAAELAIREMGISFTIYSEGKNIDRAWPFDSLYLSAIGSDLTQTFSVLFCHRLRPGKPFRLLPLCGRSALLAAEPASLSNLRFVPAAAFFPVCC